MTFSSDSPAAEAATAPSTPARPIAPARQWLWGVRREVWEHRALYVAPAAVAGLVLVAFLFSTVGLAHRHLMVEGFPAPRRLAATLFPYAALAGVTFITGVIVGLFYCLGALHNERRERSILFWKSLPVSDLVTVLSKAAIPLLVVPTILFGVIMAAEVAMFAIHTAALLVQGVSPAYLWSTVNLGALGVFIAYGFITLALYEAPVWAWLILVSGWARRAPLLWAVLPPLALVIVERVAFGTGWLAQLIGERLTGGEAQAFVRHDGSGLPTDLSLLDPGRFLASPGLWVGLLVAGGFLAAAVWRRRFGEPI